MLHVFLATVLRLPIKNMKGIQAVVLKFGNGDLI